MRDCSEKRLAKKRASLFLLNIYLARTSLGTSGLAASRIHIKGEQIQSAETYQRIDDSGNPGHVSKDHSYEVKRQ